MLVVYILVAYSAGSVAWRLWQATAKMKPAAVCGSCAKCSPRPQRSAR